MVGGRDRYLALKRLADANPDIFSVIFCRTKRDTQKVAEKLIEDGYSAGALHGDLSQNQRDLVMKSFRNKQIQMLVATDVAARGIDVDDITHVINYQLPDEVETYTHRSGRTGRAGKSGVSMVIVTKSEFRKIKSIERIIKKKFVEKNVPTGMEICEIQLYHLASKIKDTEVSEEINDYLPAIHDVLRDLDKETLIKKMVAVEFNRFYNYYKKSKDLSRINNQDHSSDDGSGNVRYFINVGEKDDYDWMSLKDFLKETLDLDRDDVFRVDVKESFSFFNTKSEHTEKILETFSDFKLDGRFINVEISKNSRGRNSRGGGRDRGRRSGGDRGRRSGRRGNDKKFNNDNKGSWPKKSGESKGKKKSKRRY
jgi:ATP-dependent RNA helicase DeaD